MVKMRDGRDSSEHIAEMKDENELLKDYIDNIASIIYYQMPLKEQDLWVEDVVAMGWYKYPNDGEDEDGSK